MQKNSTTRVTHVNATALKAFLARLPAGPVQDRRRVIELLSPIWHELTGSSDTSMAAYKLDRAENVRFEPPLLKFTIERHGAASLGSSRAEVQEWTINLDEQTASWRQAGYRQLKPNAPRLKVEPLVDGLIETVRSGTSHIALIRDGEEQVRIKQSIIIPNVGPQKTIANRRRRFIEELSRRMAPLGYELISKNPMLKFKKVKG